jgi:hypothetical protein
MQRIPVMSEYAVFMEAEVFNSRRLAAPVYVLINEALQDVHECCPVLGVFTTAMKAHKALVLANQGLTWQLKRLLAECARHALQSTACELDSVVHSLTTHLSANTVIIPSHIHMLEDGVSQQSQEDDIMTDSVMLYVNNGSEIVRTHVDALSVPKLSFSL